MLLSLAALLVLGSVKVSASGLAAAVADAGALAAAPSAAAPSQPLSTTGGLVSPTFWSPPDPAYKIEVMADGVYSLSYSALQQAGLPVTTLDPRTFRIFWIGREIAIQVEGEEDGIFQSGDAVVFYGRSIDSLYFEGTLPTHKYTGVNNYWLTYGPLTDATAAPKRMVSKDGAVNGAPSASFWQVDRQEQQRRYVTEYPRYDTGALFRPEDDHWFWYKLQSLGNPGAKAQGFSFTINAPVSATVMAQAAAKVVGAYDVPHGLRLRLNNQLIYDNNSSWHGYESFLATANVTQSLLVSGVNNLQVEIYNINSNISESYIDWVELRYFKRYLASSDQLAFGGEFGVGPWRYTVENFTTPNLAIYDVADLFHVQRVVNAVITPSVTLSGSYALSFGDVENNRRYIALSNAKRLAPAAIRRVTHRTSLYTPSRLWVANGGAGQWSLLDPRNGADWIVITHGDFFTATLPLAEYRAKKLRVAMVDVQEIYDQFNGGMLSSESIRSFLAYAYANWQAPAPQFVLLAGGGVSDMRRYLSTSKTTYVPTMIYPADPILGETASDNRLATFFADDLVPDMHLGRFPAYSASEISIMVSKTISYEASPVFNDWNTNVLFIADDLEGGGGNFYDFSDAIADGSANPVDPAGTKFLPAPYSPIKVYLGRNCDVNNPAYAAQCRAQIIDAINNQGALLVSYVGHAQLNNWASEKLMDSSLANSLTNADKLPIFLPMACFEGFFHESSQFSRSLAESYLFNPNGGAVASWSPTGFGVATGHDWLEQGFFIALFQQHLPTLGEVTTYGKHYLHANAPANKYDDLLDTYHLLGDPALHVQVYVAPTAVDVSPLTAEIRENGVRITWQSLSETDILGFNLWRSDTANGDFVRLNDQPILANLPGSASGFSYAYQDGSALPTTATWYKLEVLHLNGSSTVLGAVEAQAATPLQRIFLPLISVS